MTLRKIELPSRRQFLVIAASTAIPILGGIARPYLSLAAERPLITHGLQSGDVDVDSGVVWARADRPARMQVEVATTDSFKDLIRGAFVDVLPESDFAAKLKINDLPSGQNIFYRVRFQDLSSPTIIGESIIGQFRTGPRDKRSISFIWSGDQAGQGWGIDEARGGMRTYATMLRNRPDFFGEPLTRAVHQRRKYAEKNTLILMARASRAMREYLPITEEPTEPGRVYRKISYGPLLDIFMLDMRSYRGPNAENMQETYDPDAYFLGPQQVAWLKRELLNSRATWKVIANDMPLALIRIYDGDRNWGYEAIAQGDDGPPRGRELELANILSFIKQAGIRNTVWLTADVHYTAAHYFDPNKAAFQDFDPFWEFVSGPIHAGTGMLNDIDKTFGPQVVYAKARPRDPNLSGGPSEGLQFFGHVKIDGSTEVMTVTLKDVDDRALWSIELEPKTN